jgi:hypothetical protein
MTAVELDLTWTVWRHAGRSTDSWRQSFAGSETEAREHYQHAYRGLRQGGIELRCPRGRVVKSHWAPQMQSRR